MPTEATAPCVRTSVGLSCLDHVRRFKVSGPNAFAFLERLCSSDLFLRDGQMLHTLMLDAQAVPQVDLFLCRDDEDFVLLAEERAGFFLGPYLQAQAQPGVSVQPLDESHQLFSLDGPYAWELMAELAGPQLAGLPYLNFFHHQGWDCFRAGKTGEFGYWLLAGRAAAAQLRERIQEAGKPFDLGTVDFGELEQCALENWFFNIRREGSGALTPLELQLQWRASRRRKGYVGEEALAARRQQGIAARITQLVGEGRVAIGDPVWFGERQVGTVLNAGYSAACQAHLALGLMDLAFALPGIDGLAAGKSRATFRTATPPLLQNRSLFVSPQRDSYYSRETRAFPPLVRPRPEKSRAAI